MGRKQAKEDKALRHRLFTRVNDKKYAELCAILKQDPQQDMSSVLRAILYNRPVKVYTYDQTLDNLMEELARLRTEIRAIGVNINQITHAFHTYPEVTRKALYARMAFKEYQAIEPKIDRLLSIIQNLAVKWLQG